MRQGQRQGTSTFGDFTGNIKNFSMPEEDQKSSRAHLNDDTTDYAQLDLKKGKNASFDWSCIHFFQFNTVLAFRLELECRYASGLKDRRSLKSSQAPTPNLAARGSGTVSVRCVVRAVWLAKHWQHVLYELHSAACARITVPKRLFSQRLPVGAAPSINTSGRNLLRTTQDVSQLGRKRRHTLRRQECSL